MNSDEERNPSDIEFAQTSGRRLVNLLLGAGKIRLTDWFRVGISDLAKIVLSEAVSDVRQYQSGTNSPDDLLIYEQATIEFVRSLDKAIRLISLSRFARLPGIAVLRGNDQFGCLPIFDVFNERARRTLFLDGSGPPDPGEPHQGAAWPAWIREFLPISESVLLLDEQRAVGGFSALFVDCLRAFIKWTTSRNTNGNFTVHCGHGYQLDWYHQFNYSPVVFGCGAMSSPVVGALNTGNYCFQGWKNNIMTLDSGVYFAGPNSNVATLRSF